MGLISRLSGSLAHKQTNKQLHSGACSPGISNGDYRRCFLKSEARFPLFKSCIRVVANLKSDLFVSRLFSEPTSRYFLLIGAADKDTAFTVLRASASMKPDAASAGYLPNDGKETFELRRLRHAYTVYQRRDEIVRILQRIADRNQYFFKSTLRSLKQSPSHCLSILRHSNQFVICHVALAILVHVPKFRFGREYSDALALRSTNIAFGLCLE